MLLASRAWLAAMAAAAIVALSFVLYVVTAPTSQPLNQPQARGGGASAESHEPVAPGLVATIDRAARPMMSASAARLASFTQPLEREAQALQSDLRRVAERVRDAIPTPDLSPSS